MTFLFEILLLSRNLFGYKYDSNYIIESEDSNVYVLKQINLQINLLIVI